MNNKYHEFYFDSLKQIKRLKEIELNSDITKEDDFILGISEGREEALNEVLMYMYEKVLFSDGE